MSFENIIVFAAATGRDLVLPPTQDMYLLQNKNSFDNFYPLFGEEFQKRMHVITMKRFLDDQFAKGGYFETEDSSDKQKLLNIVNACEAGKHCDSAALFHFIRSKSYVSKLKDMKNCLVFDEQAFKNGPSAITSRSIKNGIERFCGDEREPIYFDSEMAAPDIFHFHSGSKASDDQDEYRLLNPFYSLLHFTNPVEDNYYKRFIRDFIHYKDEIFCAAGKVINLIQEEGKHIGFNVDDEGAGGFSALHVRRGDLQFKEVIISAEEWYENTAKLFQPNEILYIATDEKNRKFFDPIAKHHQIRFLDNYLEKAGLANIEKQYLGMIESIIASRGRIFVGTWHSTYSAQIMRLRGYYGVSRMSSYYAFRPRRFEMNKFIYPHGNYAAREWPSAWLGIDGDETIDKDLEPWSSSPIGPLIDVTLLKDPKPRPNRLARGSYGLPMSKTPALEGASRGTIKCDVNVDALAYWNDPQGTIDRSFASPFRPSGKNRSKQYITFWQDSGRFNNLRMSFEIIMVIAAATGRTVVLPPTQNLRLEHDSSFTGGFESFYSFSSPQFKSVVEVITMKEFIDREGGKDGVAKINQQDTERLHQLTTFCENRRKSDIYCGEVYDMLARHSDTMVAPLSSDKNCLIFDVDTYNQLHENVGGATETLVKEFCGMRKAFFYDKKLASPDILHFDTFEMKHRLLAHFYSFILFTDPVIDNHFKRFVRDFLHYDDKIFCAAGKIVRLIQQEAIERGFSVDGEGAGGYTSLHVRRDDLQFKDAVISEDRWWDNTKEIYKEKEILYIATDEKDRRFFDNFAESHDLRFLDDYWDVFDFGSWDKEHLGMIDAIVASRGRAFVGTYYSTFTGFIMRMRGYFGTSKYNQWYSWNPKKVVMQQGNFFDSHALFEREFPIGWVDIDADERVKKDKDYKNPTVYDKMEKEQIAAPANSHDASTAELKQHQPAAPISAGKGTGKNKSLVTGTLSQEEDEKLKTAGDGSNLYIIFSTDCSAFQEWQAYNLFFSALRARQPGIITRIASGCTDEQKKMTEKWHNDHTAIMSKRFKIIFTPKFSHVDVDNETGDYKYFNKPFGTKYFFENSSDFGWDKSSCQLTKAMDNDVVFLIDPDTLLLQPLTTDFSGTSVKFWKPFAKDKRNPLSKKVAPGAMFGQTYGLGTKWMQFVNLAGPKSPAHDVDERTAQLLYPVGPPYVGTANDMFKLANRWAELVRAVHKEKPQLLSEMYAYQLAAADQKLPHGVVDSMMISSVETYGEAWDYIDALPSEEACQIGSSLDTSRYPLPTLLHYCQHYGVANVLFTKHGIPPNFFSCESPLLKEPAAEAMASENAYLTDRKGKRQDLDSKSHKRHVFATCAITTAMNDAALFFKSRHCKKSDANLEKSISLVSH